MTVPVRPLRLVDFVKGIGALVEQHPELAAAYLIVEADDEMKPALSFDIKGYQPTNKLDNELLLEIKFSHLTPDQRVGDTDMHVDLYMSDDKPKGPIH